MDNSYGGWSLEAALDDSLCMRSSHDIDRDMIEDLTALGVVDLDTSIMPDMLGLRAFDSREPVVRLLPGDFRNTIRVLVPDATADIILEGLANTLDFHAKMVFPRYITSLRRRWPSSVFVNMHNDRLIWRPCAVTVSSSMSSVVVGPGLAHTVAYM